ncbi:hypothetical protein ASL14_07290 [Paenibacillus sp. IHB B 3084]|uniref:restriction endonuclease subunit S n=1 Tax=Paenibacillus sp. IHB B 3084 TaxID=867076 RepID=UPI000721BE54|nr:restriction endonuclease subunit S [Paenibacillus sp. IHB B 3084]ALP36003.1 hypothetical protein ASL14_07290 [Paenibacillus sp. IHB B 3084]
MSEHKENVPKIRFPGFTDTWEQRKLSDLMFFSNGINAPKQSYGKGRKMISVMDILSKELLTYEKIKGSVKVDNKIEQKNKVEKGDLVFVRSSEIREEVGWAKAYLQEEYALYSGFSIRGKKKSSYDAYFIELSLNHTHRNQIERKAGGSTRFNVSQEILNNIIISEPTLKEQVKISEFFRGLDNIITLHQSMLNKFKNLKTGLLQEMFPKNGEEFPEVRFPGFNDAWEQRTLGEVSPLRGGYAFQSSCFKESGVPIIKISNILFNEEVGGEYAYYEEQLNDSKYTLPDGAALLAMSGATTGKVSILKNSNNKKMYQNQRVGYFSDLNIIDYTFISIITRSQLFTNQLKSVLVAGAQPNISSKEVDSFEFYFPTNKEEQIRIGGFFKELDHLITLHQRKLEHLQEQKKALLQQMFI